MVEERKYCSDVMNGGFGIMLMFMAILKQEIMVILLEDI